MGKDYYKTLGIDKTASKDEIKKAFRKLAHKYHPDKKDGDEKKFKEVNEAYNILSDDQKRAQYDQFGQTFDTSGGGFNQAGFGGFDFSAFNRGFGSAGQSFEFDLNDILGSFFGGQGFGRIKKGADVTIDIEIDFKDSIFGLSREIPIAYRNSNKKETIRIVIPPGIDNGEMIRVRGKGESVESGRPGDLYVKIYVKPHNTLRKEGNNLFTELQIKLTEALIGTSREIETLEKTKSLSVKIPAGIKHGEILRLRELGVPTASGRRGDLLIRVSIKMPEKLSREAREAIDVLRKEGY
ncbi:MAG TPA: DnaJ C-terminal domain-containing protein [Candidatus Paceibacterota bacterium]|nr:DnaJ C-terminal domain-containing protein [Candidatus Paceibacterota bacterium]HRZ34550.1 DnaJ C-terminal domain-containing protein [Candidatus Paceibacterota bacterium]